MKESEYMDLINFEDENDLYTRLSKDAESNTVSVIGDVYLIEYLFHNFLNNNYDVVNINFDANDTDTTYILMLKCNGISIQPIKSSDNDLLKLSEKVFIDVETVKTRLASDCANSSSNVIMFSIGANVGLEDDYYNNDYYDDKLYNGADDDLYNFSMSTKDNNRYVSISIYSDDPDEIDMMKEYTVRKYLQK